MAAATANPMSCFSRALRALSSIWNDFHSAHSRASVSSGMSLKKSGTCPRVWMMSCSVSDRLMADLRSGVCCGE